MKNLYRFLASLMFLTFVAMAGALVLNNTINEIVKTADVKFDEFIKEYNEKLDDVKIIHNFYFINCFPNVCAKGSFGRYEKISTITTADINNQGEVSEEVEKTKVDKYDIGFTEFVIAKYSPLTDKITVDLNANNVLFLKNKERKGSAFFSKLNYEASASFIANYLASLTGDVDGAMESLTSDSKLTIKNPKVSYEEKRFKADFVEFASETFNVTDKTVSSGVNVVINGFAINNSAEKVDADYDLEVINLDKDITVALAELGNLKINPEKPELNQEVITEGLKIAGVVLDGVKKFDENKTFIKFNKADLKLYNSEENKVLANYSVSADLTLDANLDPVGFIKLDFSNITEDARAEIENVQFVDKKTGEVYKLFVKLEDGHYVADVKFAEGKAVVNTKEVDVSGQVKAMLDFASGMMSLIAMQAAIQ